jgi:two-component system sensor histidine kinase KdpD
MKRPQDPQPERGADERPDPEELLDRYGLRDTPPTQAARQASGVASDRSDRPRGRLRVYLGAAAGVGKTYAMLNEGRRRKERGTDVVIGYVKTHGRRKTVEQIGDLEIIPRRRVTYRGITLEEMDPDAIIARHPQVVLVDELAHTNVPGSRHPKRYQDVKDILDAGIDVITTLNVQHLESMKDIVESITGVPVRETLPDRVLDEADEVELVDISPQALRQRMKHGDIYPLERVETALTHFFREENLAALRELALRRMYEKSDEQLEQYMRGTTGNGPQAATQRVMVCFDHHPTAEQLIRHAWRIAHGLRADFLAVTVELTGWRARLWRRTAAERAQLARHIQLAEDLDATVLVAKSPRVARELARLAQEHHITHLVVGQPPSSWLQQFLCSSVTNRLLRYLSGVDILVVARPAPP